VRTLITIWLIVFSSGLLVLLTSCASQEHFYQEPIEVLEECETLNPEEDYKDCIMVA